MRTQSALKLFIVAVLLTASGICSSSSLYEENSMPVVQSSISSSPSVSDAAICQEPVGVAQNLDSRPDTIPALRSWWPARVDFQLQAGARVIAASRDLLPIARLLARELSGVSGLKVKASRGGAAIKGDIELSIGRCDERLEEEGYGLRVGEVVHIRANNERGVFYGSRSLLQLLAQSSSVAGGLTLDWPRYPERGLMVDVGRKHFTMDWLRRHIEEMAYLKLNMFHLHFSEELGFRIESDRHPAIVSAQHLSKDEVRELVDLAAQYYITVVPEIGMPSQMGAALAPYPELQLSNRFGEKNPNWMDLSLDGARVYSRELIEEFLPLFPGPYWHTGADLYVPLQDYPNYPQLEAYAKEQYGDDAVGKDAIRGHINWVADLVASRGKTTRVWHDELYGGSAVTVDTDIVVEWWTNVQPLGDMVFYPTPQQLLDRGYRIHNASWFPTYYIVGGLAGLPPGLPPRASMRDAYENWEVHEFYGPLYFSEPGLPSAYPPPLTVSPDDPNNLGAKLHVWCDGPEAETEQEIAVGIVSPLRVIAQKTWNSKRLTSSYAEFQVVMDDVGHAPGY